MDPEKQINVREKAAKLMKLAQNEECKQKLKSLRTLRGLNEESTKAISCAKCQMVAFNPMICGLACKSIIC